jgi:molecular chaperone DnaK
MEAVAFGAAIQAGVLTGEVKDIVLLDVTPLSLGLETLGGVMTKIIDKNTTIPIKKSQVFTTAEDNQPAVDIHIYQGERQLAKGNIELGQFELTGIPPARRGVPQIEVTFDIDANGILHVHAKDKATGKEQSMQVVAPNKMSREDIDKKIHEAEEHAEEDKATFEKVQVHNEAEAEIYTAERQIKDFKEKMTKELYEKVEAAKKELEDAAKTDNTADIKAKTLTLREALQEIGASMYGKGGDAPPGPEAGADAGAAPGGAAPGADGSAGTDAGASTAK